MVFFVLYMFSCSGPYRFLWWMFLLSVGRVLGCCIQNDVSFVVTEAKICSDFFRFLCALLSATYRISENPPVLRHSCCFAAQLFCGTVVVLRHSCCFAAQLLFSGTVVVWVCVANGDDEWLTVSNRRLLYVHLCRCWSHGLELAGSDLHDPDLNIIVFGRLRRCICLSSIQCIKRMKGTVPWNLRVPWARARGSASGQ